MDNLTKENAFKLIYIMFTQLDDELPYTVSEEMDQTCEDHGTIAEDFANFIKDKYPNFYEQSLSKLINALDEKDDIMSSCDASTLAFIIEGDENDVLGGIEVYAGLYLYADYLSSKNCNEAWKALNDTILSAYSDIDADSFNDLIADPDMDLDGVEDEVADEFKMAEEYFNTN